MNPRARQPSESKSNRPLSQAGPGRFERQVEELGLAAGVKARPKNRGQPLGRRFLSVVVVAVKDQLMALRLPAGDVLAKAASRSTDPSW